MEEKKVIEEVVEKVEGEEIPSNIDEIEASYDAPVEEAVDTRTVEEKHWDMLSSIGEIKTDVVKNLIGKFNIEDISTIQAISDIIKRKLAGEKFNEYKELPNQIKQYINFQLTIQGCPGNKTIRNALAKRVVEELTNDYRDNALGMDLDTVMKNFETDLRKTVDDFAKGMGKEIFMDSMNDERLAEMDAAIDKAIAEGNNALASKISESKASILAAYDLTDFKEFCKKVKISKFDCEKPSRKYGDFLYKFEKCENNVDDVRRCPAILDYHIPGDKTKNLKYVLAFCDYIKNMNPSNFKDYTFIYYFIRNIIVLDKINPRAETYEAMDDREKKFYDGLIENIKECESYIK